MTTATITLTNKEWRNELNLRHELSYLYLKEKHNDGCPGMGSTDA